MTKLIIELLYMFGYGWKQFTPVNMKVGDRIRTPEGNGNIISIQGTVDKITSIKVRGFYSHSIDKIDQHAPPGYRKRGVEYEVWTKSHAIGNTDIYKISRLPKGKRDVWNLIVKDVEP